MILKSVELFGFKSFPERTRIDFNRGITAIIGPNGSGKSNISDAVRWVLGEMSMKSLRGSKMEDVIFNGAVGVSPANFASVSLILDTSEEYFKKEAEKDKPEQDEVKANRLYSLGDNHETIVTRKLYRSGESEYYINKKQVRLKDIYELFYDTGIGREGYSVIGQGKISDVLSQKDDERRSIFEEAAGISKHRYKKTEAERKLRDTENNLVRVNDILGEISARIGPLEKEAENAKLYLELSEEKRGLEITIWLEKIEKVRAEYKAVEENCTIAKLRLEELEAKLSGAEAMIDASINNTYELSKTLSEKEHELSDTEKDITATDGELAVLETEIKHLERVISDAEAIAKQAGIELQNVEKEINEVSIEAAEKTEILSEKRREYEKLSEEYSEERKNRDEMWHSLEKTRESQEEFIRSLSEKRLEMASLEAKFTHYEAEVGELNSRKEEADSRLRELGAEGEKINEQIDSKRSDSTSLRDERSKKQNEIASLESEIEEKRAEVNKINLAIAAKEQKRENLERMERLFEGYSDSVKRILNAAREFKLRCKVYGTVSNLISTNNDYVVAIETALGASIQNIVVDDEDDAKACIRFLKDNKAGRATFLPVSTMEGRVADVSKIKNIKGYLGIASDFVETDDMFKNVAENLLGRTVLVDNIDNAVFVARGCGYKIKIVTLDGQVINAGGSYTGGSSNQKTGIMTRSLDIEKIGEELKVCENELLEAEIAQRRLENKYNKLKTEIEEISSEISETDAEIAALTEKYMSIGARYSEQEQTIKQLLARIEEGEAKHLEEQKELETAKNNIESLEKMLDESTAELERIRTSHREMDENERETFTLLNEHSLRLREAESEVERCSERIQYLTRTKDAISERTMQNQSTVATAKREIEEAGEKISVLKAKKDELVNKCSELKDDIASIKKEQIEEQLNTDKLRSESKQVASDKDEAFVAYTNAKSRLDGCNSELELTTSKLWDEYELSYSDALQYRLPPEKMDKAPSRLSTLKSKIRSLGVINVNAVEEYRTTKERFDFLNSQVDDLNKTRRQLDNEIGKLETTMKTTFLDCFARINAAFGEVFTELFGGGNAFVALSDPDEPLTSGIEINVKPPNKTVKSISLLSGGEQSFAAMALYLALQKINPAPFCIFDEIESALDEVNVNKFAEYLKNHSEYTQYILITHRRGTMENADTIYGVTMHKKGISDYLKVDLNSIEFKNIR